MHLVPGSGLYYILLFALSFLGVLLITPLIFWFAFSYNIVDKPGLHKTHKKPTPLLGGVSIFLCFAVIIFTFIPLDKKLLSLAIATVVLVTTGLLDDLYNLKPALKLSGQIVAALIIVLWNANLFRFMVIYFARFYLPAWLVLFLIIGWLVLMVNAFNLIDGVDGLAAGTAAIIFLAMALLSYIEGGRSSVLGVQLIGAGACLGFLVFNYSPAKIFMGDTGSMLLGFILASSHLFTIKYPFSAQLVLGSMFIFAYPALDVGYAIYRRVRSKRSIFKADQGHIHHVLLSLGFSVRKTVMIIYVVNIVFAAAAVLLLYLNISTRTLFVVSIMTFFGVLLTFKKLLKISNVNGVNT